MKIILTLLGRLHGGDIARHSILDKYHPTIRGMSNGLAFSSCIGNLQILEYLSFISSRHPGKSSTFRRKLDAFLVFCTQG